MSFIDRLRRLGGGLLRGTDAYWPDMSDDVGDWIHYHVDHRDGAHAILVPGRCADFHWPDLLGALEGRLYIATGEVSGLREANSRRYQAAQD